MHDLHLLLLVPALAAAGMFARGVRRDRRRFGNGVYLLVALLFGTLWVWQESADAGLRVIPFVLMVVVLSAPLGFLVLTGFLVANGVVLIRREGRGVVDNLPLLAGLGMLALAALLVVAVAAGGPWFLVAVLSVCLVASYLGFLFTGFLLYSVVYGRIRHRGAPDAIVVLGSGLLGARVPPLLAARLDRAATAYREEVAAGRDPFVVPSGGRGPDEEVAEGEAMAAYLVERGVPAGRILVEDRATTTRENLRYGAELVARATGRPDPRLLVVTSNFHVLRAAILTRHLGLRAAAVGSRTARYYLPTAVLREFAAMVAEYRVANAVMSVALAAALPLLLLVTS
ncbi:Uncharacterized SAM-binding protein YcdF, DUF218 family [Amycolatopsis arida]|uniref:Uncharacterized SAM-binding protein YcdF, DUF218 family n=1 Tax=Amycolatopsis arida TaxID=587909 RepID=A0A1I6ASF7_9PSEU|nr:YdcF family protein [Amycolatopsis arida]TDX97558.1 uncharacterized SAM-binding protein YcdF (DUF218 family) [Amycolatopsis arida]SFQ71566.1 Uncharacterized SAM-binding protein YcdF, DUF218 family [Amycolatopsis arida]